MPKARAKTKHIEHKAELIELLLTEPINAGNDKGNPVLAVDKEKPIGFAEKFSSLLYETPNVGSTSDPEFFIHGILGSVLMLPESGLVEKLGINKMYVKHTKEHVEGSKRVKDEANVVKLCFSLEKDGKKQVALRVFTSDGITGGRNPEDRYRYSDDELKEIAGKLGISDIDNVDEHVFRICTEGDPGNKSFRLHKWQIGRVKEKFKIAASSQSQINNEFKEISIAQSTNLEGASTKLSSKNVEEVKGGTKDIFDRLIEVYKDNQEKLSLSNTEAAYHGFHYGALALNFKYRSGLNCYAERIAGKGRADLIFMSRTKDANGRINPKPIPIVVEFKGEGHTADEAIAQIKNKGYLYNLSVRTKAEEAVIVGIGKGGGLKVEKDDIFQSRGFIHQLLEEIDESDISEMQESLKDELKNLYYSIQSHDRHYLSKLVLGQVLAVEDNELDKYIFTYTNQDKSIRRETTTFVLSNQDEGKAVILNIIERSGEQRVLRGKKESDSKRIPPIDELKINSAVKIDVIINTGVQHKPDGFEVEGGEDKSYYQDINIEKVSGSSQGKFQGQFKKIESVEVGNLVKDLQKSSDIGRTRGDKKSSDRKLEESLSPLAEVLFPFKGSIKREVELQAIIQGLFINGKTEDGTEVRVYAESNISAKGRIDLALSFTQLSENDGFLIEDDPIIIELKYANSDSDASRKLKQAEEQLSEKYTILRSFTDKKTSTHLAIVFNNRAKNEKGMIMASMRSVDVYHTTSGSSPEKKRPGSPLAGCPKRQRQERSIGVPLCIDSHDKEDVEEKEKEERIKELFDTDEIREKVKSVELYDELFKVSEKISRDEIVDIGEAFITKVRDIDLNLVDPEIRGIVREIKEKINEEVNKESIKNIFKRSGVAAKISKVAEGAGLAFTTFLVGKHIVNGNTEGLGYDALNLWIMPKIGEKISGKMLELGTLKGFAPVMGRAVGNFAAFLGLAESIKAWQSATDPVDIKIADLSIATNSIFIAADVPAVVTETISAIGMEAGVIGEFAGPVGAAVSIAVIIISQFVEAGLEVEKLEEHINLTDKEKRNLYWDFFLGKKVPDYIEDDIEAEQIYKQYVSNIVSRFKDQYNVIAMSLPKIFITKEDYVYNMAQDVGCTLKSGSQDKPNKFGFELSTNVELFNITSTNHYSRVVLNNVRDYNIFCGPLDSDIRAQFVNSTGVLFYPYKLRDGCYQTPHDGVVKRTLEQWLLQEYPYQCKNAVVYKSRNSNKHKSIYYILSQNANIRPYANYNATVIFYGKNISILSDRNKDVGSKIENRYYFEKPLENCNVHKSGSNFFYIVEDKLPCNLGTGKQKNVVVIQGNFTDSENIHSIIGSDKANHIEVSYADYVDGKGGNDVITAKNFTTIKGYFGDSIYGKGLVLLPINFDHIGEITYADNRVIVYNQNGQFINIDKQALIKTADEGIDIFVTPIKVEDSTKKVTDLHMVANVKNETITECEDPFSNFFISAITEDVVAGELKSVGSASLKRFFNEPYRDGTNCLIIDSVLIIFISALKGWLLNHPNFRVTKQLFGKNYDVTIGNSGNYLFYADKQQHNFYWEAPDDKNHLYLFDDKDVNVVINKANGLLDFSRVKRGSRFKVGITEGATTIDTGNVSVVLAPGCKNVTMTFNGKEYYKLFEGVKLERDYCSHSLRVNGRFSVNSADLINHYNCFTFDSDKVLFLKLNNNLLLLSDKGILSILDYYFFFYFPNHYFYKKWDLSIKLDGRVIKPEEFRERDSNPSSFKYYRSDEQVLQIYHNQPVNKNDIGLVDLKDKSILDFDVKVVSDDLVLSYKNNTLIKVENWNTYQPAREMMFAFNDAVVSNLRCIASICNPKDVIVDFNKEKVILLKERMFNAIAQDNVNEAGHLIRKVRSIDIESSHELRPLHLTIAAIRMGRLHSVKTLFNRGYFSIRDKDIRVLHWAIRKGKLDIAKFLIDQGADIESQNIYNERPLHLAVKAGSLDIIKLLFNEGANINVKDKDGKTPLDLATQGNDTSIVEFLRQAQLDLDRELSNAAQGSCSGKIKNLVSRGADINIRSNDRSTPLHLAAKKGYLCIVKELIENGARVDVKNRFDETPLHCAAREGFSDVIKELIRRGANIVARGGNFYRTPLHLAAKGGYLGVVKELVKVDINARDKNGDTPLHLAAKEGRLDVVGKLIENNADINIRNYYGSTPLYKAAEEGYLSTVKKFMENGAYINIRNRYDKTPLDVARDKGHDSVVQYLEGIERERGKPVRRERRHHHGDHDHHHSHLSRKPLAIDLSNQPEVAARQDVSKNSLQSDDTGYNKGKATSGGNKPSSWTNDLFGWVKSSIGGLSSSKSEGTASSASQVDTQFASVSNGSSNRNLDTEEITKHKLKCRKDIPNSTSTTSSNSTGQKQEGKHYFMNGDFFQDNTDYVNANLKQMHERQTLVKFKPSGGNTILEMGGYYLSQIDFNGTIMLLDVLVRKVTGQKYISTVDQSISPLEAQGYALNITKGCEKVVEQAGLKSGVSMHRLNIDFVEIQKEVTGKIMSGKFNEIWGILSSYVERACPGREAGKLSPRKFDKFMVEFDKGLDVIVNQPMQQILNNRDSTLEANGVKEQQMNSEPQSYLSNASVQGHLTRDKVKLIS